MEMLEIKLTHKAQTVSIVKHLGKLRKSDEIQSRGKGIGKLPLRRKRRKKQ